MNNLKTYEFGADVGALMNAHETGLLPEHWEAAFRAMVSEIVSMVSQKSRAIYLCSGDRDADARNYLGFVLARLLGEHIPEVLVVDCDFLSVGMSGIIPHRDALGFLDLLLYGTSLGVITQQNPQGAKVVGAGSFAVTKQSPFAMDAFVTARRYLVNQAKCVLFVGPVADDDGNLHPIAQNVDLVALVRVGDHFDARVSDPVEQKIASIKGVEARSIRLNTKMARPVGGEARRPAEVEPTLVAQVEELVGRPAEKEPVAPLDRRMKTGEEPPGEKPKVVAKSAQESKRGAIVDEREIPGPRLGRRRSGSRAVRVITSLVAIVAVVFVVWWLYLTRSVRERGGPGPERAKPPVVSVHPRAADSLHATAQEEQPPAATPEVSAIPGTVPETAIRREEPSTNEPRGTAVRQPETATEGPRGTSASTRPTMTSTPDSIQFVQTLDQFAGWYVIHAGSFRGSEKAKEEAFYLLGWGYPVFIYHVDLGSRGMWYRVYVGPYATLEEATQRKIKLDENPRITSTRVSKVPG